MSSIFTNMGLGGQLLSKEVVMVLTPLGKEKVNAFEEDGPELRVLTTLDERGPCTADEISKATNYGTDKIKTICNALYKKGYIKRAN